VDRQEFGEGFPADGLFIQADIADPANIEMIYARTSTFTTTLSAVVNNAAMQVTKPLLETSVEEWDQVIASNLRSVFLGAKLAHPLLKAGGAGAIVNVSSVHAVATSANISAYAASKGGLLALTRAMAIEFAADNIRVNAILPGAVDTPMLRAGLKALEVPTLLPGILVWRVVFVSLVTAAFAFALDVWATSRGLGAAETRTIVVNAVVAMGVGYLFAARQSRGTGFSAEGLRGTPAVWIGIITVAVAQSLLTWAPLMNRVFGTAPLGLIETAACIGAGAALLVLVEIEKAAVRRLGGERRRRSLA
jgi:NAD(P)-dependent dehydrogenase (short-subunit alcohol dehydrogenase family)